MRVRTIESRKVEALHFDLELPVPVQKWVSDQQRDVLEDVALLVPGAERARSLLRHGEPARAAGTLRAWATMALSCAQRLEVTCAFEHGARTAVTAPAECRDVTPVVVAAKEFSDRVARGEAPAARRPSNGGARGPEARRYDCGPYGMLTVAEMAEVAGIGVSSMYLRLRKNMAPVDACKRVQRTPASGFVPKSTRHVAEGETFAL